jgi:hypothetical protein
MTEYLPEGAAVAQRTWKALVPTYCARVNTGEQSGLPVSVSLLTKWARAAWGPEGEGALDVFTAGYIQAWQDREDAFFIGMAVALSAWHIGIRAETTAQQHLVSSLAGTAKPETGLADAATARWNNEAALAGFTAEWVKLTKSGDS